MIVIPQTTETLLFSLATACGGLMLFGGMAWSGRGVGRGCQVELPWLPMRRRLLGISPREATFQRRGFQPACDTDRQWHLERLAQAFVDGYNRSLTTSDPNALARQLNEINPLLRGFAFEGAGMGCALLDRMSLLGGSRYDRFLAGPAEPHAYMVHVGAGWAAARLPWVRHRFTVYLQRFDPLLRWLVADGFGFHEGFFSWRQTIHHQRVPRMLRGYARRCFDQGVGRSLWFVHAAEPNRIATSIRSFTDNRRGDLWSGVGLACAYAGVVEERELRQLVDASGPFAPCLSQGAAFAAKARQRAGNVVAHTHLACQIICLRSLEDVAAITDECLAELNREREVDDTTYEQWRLRIQRTFTDSRNVAKAQGISP